MTLGDRIIDSMCKLVSAMYSAERARRDQDFDAARRHEKAATNAVQELSALADEADGIGSK